MDFQELQELLVSFISSHLQNVTILLINIIYPYFQSRIFYYVTITLQVSLAHWVHPDLLARKVNLAYLDNQETPAHKGFLVHKEIPVYLDHLDLQGHLVHPDLQDKMVCKS